MELSWAASGRPRDNTLYCLITRAAALNKPQVLAVLPVAAVWVSFFILPFLPPAAAAPPQWRNTGDVFPAAATQVRAMIVRQGEFYVGLGGNVSDSAQVWKLTESGWVQQFQFQPRKVAVLQTDDQGRLFVGMGTPHSAEQGGPGEAEFRAYDANDKLIFRKEFKDKDVIYSMAWYNGKLNVGTMTEDIPGSAEIWRFDEPGWTQIAGDGIPGWPGKNTYAAVYEMWVHDGELYAGIFSRTMGDGDVLKLTADGWIDLEAPKSIIAIALVTFQDKLVVALSKYQANLLNPVVALQRDGSWQPLGEAPSEWKDAHIHNHFAVMGDDLYVGVGGRRGTISVWKFDGAIWSKVAGDGLHGSWRDPLAQAGSAEWVYRMIVLQGRLYVGLASDASSLAAVWEMTQ